MKSSFGAYKYAIIVGIDGAGCFYPDDTNTPNIDKIFKNGAKTYKMRVTSPTASSVSWMSCLHGVPPENHGNKENIVVETGGPYPMESNYPSVLRVVKEAKPNEEVACIYAWSGINGIVESDAGIYKEKMGDASIVSFLEGDYLAEKKPILTYLHINLPDAIGHHKGHRTPEYYESIETVDGYIGRIYDAYCRNGMIEDTLFIVTSDHGGVCYTTADGIVKGTHGGLHPDEKYALFAVCGKNITNTEIGEMYIHDTSAVVLHALGIEQPRTYTSIVPGGIFADVEPKERVEYHDPDLPRYRIPVNTPDFDGALSVTNFVDRKLAIYMPFDGSTRDLMRHDVTEFGKISYRDGYFGEGVELEDGYLNLNGFAFGNDSWTLSFWVKCATPTNGASPVISNKPMSSSADGFVYALGRYASVERQDHYGYFNVAKDGVDASIKENMNPDYIYGWMHVAIVIDREAGELRVAYDFGDFLRVKLPENLSKGVSLDNEYGYLSIGEDTTGHARSKVGVALDELMIFEGAFDSADLEKLKLYFKYNA